MDWWICTHTSIKRCFKGLVLLPVVFRCRSNWGACYFLPCTRPSSHNRSSGYKSASVRNTCCPGCDSCWACVASDCCIAQRLPLGRLQTPFEARYLFRKRSYVHGISFTRAYPCAVQVWDVGNCSGLSIELYVTSWTYPPAGFGLSSQINARRILSDSGLRDIVTSFL
jgi:hypothetical protein